MDRASFRRVKTLFEVLSVFPHDEHGRLLEELCPDDPEVRQLVTELLDEPRAVHSCSRPTFRVDK